MAIRRSMTVVLQVVLVTLLFPASHLFAQAEPAVPALPNVEVKEWVVIVCDPAQRRVNPAATIGGSLPSWVNTIRPVAAADKLNEPSPIGVIRFTGQTDQKITVRLLTRGGGTFHAAWPSAPIRAGEVIWRDLTLSALPRQPASIESAHWLNPLRNAAGPYLITAAGRSERFLLYDAEFPYFLPLKLAGGKTTADPIQVGNTGSAPLYDLVFYRPPRDGNGWMTGTLAEILPLPAGGEETPSTAYRSVSFTPTVGGPEEFLFTDWKARLATWELDPADLDMIVRTLKNFALDEKQMTAVFRLDEAEVNRLLTLEITPRPHRIRRLALVIVRNVDPMLPTIIDQLIAQLGDPDWLKREAASKLLAEYSPAANSALRAALRSSDSEIVLRAERLLGRQ